jgi:hypothetical protein
MEFIAAKTTLTLRFNVRDRNANFPRLLTADRVEAVTCSVILLTDIPHIRCEGQPVDGYDKMSLDPPDVFGHTQRISGGDVGNFEHTFPAGNDSPFQRIGRDYLVRYEITPVDGEPAIYPFRVQTY